jgi:hypothetical protein
LGWCHAPNQRLAFGRLRRQHVGFHHAGFDQNDMQIHPHGFSPRRVGERLDGMFRGAIGTQESTRGLAPEGRDQNQAAAMAAQSWNRRFQDAQAAHGIGIQDFLEFGDGRDLDDAGARYRGRVDDCIERLTREQTVDFGESGLHRGRIGHVHENHVKIGRCVEAAAIGVLADDGEHGVAARQCASRDFVSRCRARRRLREESACDLVHDVRKRTILGILRPMIPRTLFSSEHEQFRDSVRRFVDKEIVPHHERWEEAGMVDRELWTKAGAAGLLCPSLPETYGGFGADFLFNVVIIEELARAGATGPGFSVHSDMVATYIYTFGTEEQKQRWLPKMVTGEVIGA